MSEETTAQAGTVDESTGSAESRTFTQDVVNSLLARERRQTEAKFEGYADFKAKAEQFDAQQEAAKSELEKANDALAKANNELAQLKAEKVRAEAIEAAAKEYGVDADTLARMTGNVDENAQFLKAKAAAQPKYPDVADEGSSGGKAKPSAAQAFGEAIEQQLS